MRKRAIILAPALLCALLLFITTMLTLTGVAQGQAAPSPTVPSWNKPNLHLYFVDGNGQGVSGLLLRLYDVKFDPQEPTNVDKTQLIQLWEARTNGQGRADFDATTILENRNYYLEVKEADGTAVLPFDPNVRPRPPAGNVNLKTKDMALLSLTKGSIVYVTKWKVQPLLTPGTSRQALSWPVENWEYWPTGNSDLLVLSQPTTSASGVQTSLSGRSSTSPVDTGNPIITGAVKPGIGQMNTPVPGATTTSPSTQYAPGTPTPVATCRYCNLTDNPATITAYAAGVGAGRGSGGKITPTPFPAPVLTQRADRALTDIANGTPAATIGGNGGNNNSGTPAATGAGVVLTAPVEANVNSPSAGSGDTSSQNTNSQQAGGDFPWLIVLVIIGIVGLGLAALVWKLARKK